MSLNDAGTLVSNFWMYTWSACGRSALFFASLICNVPDRTGGSGRDSDVRL